MKKLTTSILAVVLTSSFALVNAQKVDTARTQDIEGVVVTALGIKREKKSLGYATQEISGETISDAGQNNAVSALSGNVAGVQVTAPSTLGGSTRITMRGISSITGENRPLIIVDGVPLDNSNINSTDTQRGAGGLDYGDASFDLNPDDIENVTVLKGGPAAALYGSRAANGVIIYTTKSAKKGRTTIDFNSGISFEEVSIMPNLQNQYGGGSGDFEKVTIEGKEYNVPFYAYDESWGPKYDSNLMYLPWYAFDKEYLPNEYLKAVPWVAPKHGVKDFFDKGMTLTNNVAFSKSFGDTNVRVSYTNTNIHGIVPTSKIDKNNLSVNLNSKLSEKLEIESVVNYVQTAAFNRPEVGYGDNSFGEKFFQWGQRQLDYSLLEAYYLRPDGTQRSWNRNSWDDGTPAYHDNPYWTIYKNTNDDTRQRFFGNAGLTYHFNKNFYTVFKVYGDVYSQRNQTRTAVGSVATSGYDLYQRSQSEYNYEGRLHFDKNFGDFSLNSFIGANRRESKTDIIHSYTVGGLIIPDLYNLNNGWSDSKTENSFSQRRVNSAFGYVSLGYKDFIFVEGTGRNDWFSTVNNSIFYPSVTGSFVFSKLVNADWLSFAKLRLGWANVGNDTGPYRLRTYVNINSPFYGNPQYDLPNTLNNENLKPELKTTSEIGMQVDLFKNRAGFDVTYYDSKSKDLIIPLQVDAATGYSFNYVNAGLMTNKGIEASVYVKPFKTENFSWDLNLNFSKNKNVVEELVPGADTYQYTIAPFRAQLMAVKGMAYGQIYGTDFTYDANGNKIVSAGGTYVPSEIKSLGSVLPDYNMGLRNTFKYKSLSLSFLIDMQKGGKYFSTTHMWGMYSGMLEESALGGNREAGYIIPGVLANGTPNTKVLDAETWGSTYYNTVDAQNVFDASYFKLRDLTLAYDLPKTWLTNTGLTGLRISAFGRNLLAWGLDWKGMDPENVSYGSGNIQGLEGGSLPSTRTYGVNVNFKF
ncbi:MAG: SusC/RagA family TonB-linked outer membrane protein [Weeksellaceae bacterium]|nr:SusC/RagA family TonB-linked outer membrane protein [Bacteroidota bacterium]MCG2781817.1 SusC/RagA family TonB-linked outer membrane protein [Weeksellaceae bacterium]